jgi:hypothetical protein
MEESIPWFLGFLLGVGYPRPFENLRRGIIFVVLVIAVGSGVSLLNGEWSDNMGYALVDIGQTWLAASITMFVRPYFIASFRRPLRETAQR